MANNTASKSTAAAATTVRRSRTRKPAAVQAEQAVEPTKVQDALVAEAAPTLVDAEGNMIRATRAYVADLSAPGVDNEKRQWDALLEKPAGENAVEFVEWLQAKCGFEMDAKAAAMVLATYKEFQASPEHKAKTIAKRAAALEAKTAAAVKKAARAKAAAADLTKEELEALLASKSN